MDSLSHSLRVSAVFFLVLALLACVPAGPRSGGQPRADHALGLRVAAAMQVRYDDQSRDCGTAARPAFLCTGVLMRSVSASAPQHAWDPKPANPKPGGISFSWMRRDAQFAKLAHGYGQGFVLLPPLKYGGVPYQDTEVLCMFPVDAASDERGQSGCGAHRHYLADSGPCQSHTPPIATAAAWVIHFVAVSGKYERHNHQCGFTVRTGTVNSAGVFQEALAAMRGIGSESFEEQNEMVLQEWTIGSGRTLPLEAFFYMAGSDGLVGARKFQQDFSRTVGIWRPVIRITFASSPGSRATFTYASGDQAP